MRPPPRARQTDEQRLEARGPFSLVQSIEEKAGMVFSPRLAVPTLNAHRAMRRRFVEHLTCLEQEKPGYLKTREFASVQEVLDPVALLLPIGEDRPTTLLENQLNGLKNCFWDLSITSFVSQKALKTR